MRILVTDAFCSANRGDAAILDGILTGLRARLPDVALTVSTRFPGLTRKMHGVDAIDDRDVVAVAEAIDAARAVQLVGYADRETLKSSLSVPPAASSISRLACTPALMT
jgi:polysaccharide pyruvyl transferase WcaK-like protein